MAEFQFGEKAFGGVAPSTAGPIQRLVVTGEIFQPGFDGRPTLAGEVRWLANLLRYPISLACPGKPLEVVTWEPRGDGAFDGDKFYSLNDSSSSVENWARLVDASSISADAAEYLASVFRDAFVVGYGMSNVMLKFFNQASIPYIDFVLHAARFLDDIFYGIRTNVPEIYAALSTHRYAEEMIHLEAGIHRASLLRNPPVDIAPDSGLFAAQFGIDKALVAGGRFTRVEDYRDQIAGFLARHRTIYVKPHPYAREGGRLVAFLRAMAGDSGRVRLVRDNAYLLMVQPSITEVCGISSCVLYEAEYFGKPSVHMSPNRLDFGAKGDATFHPWRFVPVYDEFLSPDFWSHILAPVCAVSAAPALRLPRKTNRLRNNLHIYWGYGYLDFEVPLRGMGIHPPPPPVDQTPARDCQAEGEQRLRHGDAEQATNAFADAVVKEETPQRWCDWGAARLAAGHPQDAADGFRMALRLDPANSAAAAQLRALNRT